MNVSTAINAASALILAVATAFMATATSAIWDQGAKLGSIEAKLDNLAAVAGKIEGRVSSIDERVADKESDPAMLLAKIGIPVETIYVSVRVRNSFYIIPKSEAAKDGLVQAGFQLLPIGSTVQGFKVDLVSAPKP